MLTMKNYRNKILPQFGLITFNTKTSTILVSRTKISIAIRSYPGGLVKVKSFTVLPQNV